MSRDASTASAAVPINGHMVPPPFPTSTPLAYAAAILTRNCEGYPAGTTGLIAGFKQGCLVFAPDEPSRVARWARPRATMLVPAALIAIQVVASFIDGGAAAAAESS